MGRLEPDPSRDEHALLMKRTSLEKVGVCIGLFAEVLDARSTKYMPVRKHVLRNMHQAHEARSDVSGDLVVEATRDLAKIRPDAFVVSEHCSWHRLSEIGELASGAGELFPRCRELLSNVSDPLRAKISCGELG